MTLAIAKSKKYLNKKILKKEFNKNGWVLCKNEIPKPLIKKIKRDWDFYFNKQISLKANEAIKKINKNNKKLLHQICVNLSNSSSFLEVLQFVEKKYKNIFGKNEPIFCMDNSLLPGIPKDKRLVYNFHQESRYYKGSKNLLTAYFPIYFKSEIKNGSMSALNKSHTLGQISNTHKEGKKNGNKSFVPNKIESFKKQFPEVIFEVNVGDILYFHENLLHKSNFNSTNNCRIVGQLRCSQSF